MMTLVNFDEAVIDLMQFSLVISTVILHFQCFDFHNVLKQH